jgi:hypothetical protein
MARNEVMNGICFLQAPFVVLALSSQGLVGTEKPASD